MAKELPRELGRPHILAALVTFPLTLGLLQFESVGERADRYQVHLSRVGTLRFDAASILGWLIFHALDIAAVLVLAGVFIFLRRRAPGAPATERGNDFLALAGLFAVSRRTAPHAGRAERCEESGGAGHRRGHGRITPDTRCRWG